MRYRKRFRGSEVQRFWVQRFKGYGEGMRIKQGEYMSYPLNLRILRHGSWLVS